MGGVEEPLLPSPNPSALPHFHRKKHSPLGLGSTPHLAIVGPADPHAVILGANTNLQRAQRLGQNGSLGYVDVQVGGHIQPGDSLLTLPKPPPPLPSRVKQRPSLGNVQVPQGHQGVGSRADLQPWGYITLSLHFQASGCWLKEMSIW